MLPAAMLPLSISALSDPFGGGEVKVLLVGDSWADYMWQDRVLSAVFAAEGRADIREEGSLTALSGSTAAEWASPAMLALISDELDRLPSVEVVQLTMGGNDFLAGISGGGWHTGLTPLEEEALFMRVAGDVQTVIDHILDHDPSLKILISLYDYPNFVETLGGLGALFCIPLYNDLGQPTPLEINQVQQDFFDEVVLMVAGMPEVFLVSHLGMMQFHFGYPSMGILSGELLPPGDLELPSPPESLRFGGNDCFHLSNEGYLFLAQNLWDQFYIDAFCRTLAQIIAGLPAWPAEQDIADLVGELEDLCPL